MKNTQKIIICTIVLSVIIIGVSAYKQEPGELDLDRPNNYTHQKMTKEAEIVWPLIPIEIKEHLTNELGADPNDEVSFESIFKCNATFSEGDDIITGSGE